MFSYRLLMRCAVLVTVVAPLAHAQETPSQSQQPDISGPILRTETRVVNVDVSVTDKRTGMPVQNLKQADFEIMDEGRPQPVAYFAQGASDARPLAIMLVVELRAFGAEHYLSVLRHALEPALAQLAPQDAVGVMVFNTIRHDGVQTPDGYSTVQPLTTNRQLVLQALDKLLTYKESDMGMPKGRDTGDSASYALVEASTQVQASMPGAHGVIVGISHDQNGTFHLSTYHENMQKLASNGTTVFGLIQIRGSFAHLLSAFSPIAEAQNPNERIHIIEHASDQTGGESLSVREDDFSSPLEKIIRELKARYSLGFVPQTMDGKFHKIEVKVKPQNGANASGDLKIRARMGYLAASDTSGGH